MSEAAERDLIKEWAEARGLVVGGGVDYVNGASFNYTGTDGEYLVTITKGVVDLEAEPEPEPAKPAPEPAPKPAPEPAPKPTPTKEPVKAAEKPARTQK